MKTYYLNWIFLDDQFNYVSSLSGAVPAASSTYPAGTLNTVAPGSPININRSGYLYIWVSNEFAKRISEAIEINYSSS